MEILTTNPWLSIPSICIGLIIIGLPILTVIGIFVVSARLNSPEHYDRVLERAKRKEQSGQQQAAIEQLKSAIETLEKNEKRTLELDIRFARLLLECGRMQVANNTYAAALSVLRKAITTRNAERTTVDAAVIAILSAHSVESVDVQHYVEYVARATNPILRNDPFVDVLNESDVRKMLGNTGARVQAVKLVTSMYAKGVTSPWLLRICAHEMVSGDKSQAVQILQRLAIENQATREDRRLLAELLTLQGDHQESLRLYEQLAGEADANATDFRIAGLAALKSYDASKKKEAATLDTAVKWLVKATSDEAGDASTWAALGQVQRLRGALQDSRAAFERAITLGTSEIPTYVSLAEVLLDLKAPEQARPHLERAAERAQTNGGLWARAGRLAFELGDTAYAINHLEAALRCSPVPAGADLLLAEAQHLSGNHSRVVELLKTQADMPLPLRQMLGRSLAHIGNNAEAIDQLHIYLGSNATDQRTQFELGMLYGRVSQWAKAATHFNKVTDKQLRATALPYFIYVSLRNQNHDAIAPLMQQAASIGLQSGLLHHAAAVLAIRSNDFYKARAEWTTALQLDPTLIPALYGFAHFCETQREYERAAQLYAALQQLEPRPKIAIRIGICQTRAGEFASAISILESAGATANTNQEALECLAYSHAKLKQWNKAEAALARLPSRGRMAAYTQRNAFVIDYHRAQEAYAAADYEPAISLLEKLSAQNPDQSAITRSLYAAQTALVSSMLPPSADPARRTVLRSALHRLAQIAPMTFLARVPQALLASSDNADKPIDWKQFSNVRPTDWAQALTLAALAIAAGKNAEAAHLVESIDETKVPGGRPWQLPYLRGVAALNQKNWSDAFEQMKLCLTSAIRPGEAQTPTILRTTVAAAVRVQRTTEALDLLRVLKNDSPDKQYLLGMLLMVKGDATAAQAALNAAGADFRGVPEARRAIMLAAARASALTGNWQAALDSIKAAPADVLTQPAVQAAKLDLLLRTIETDASGSTSVDVLTQLRNAVEEFLMQPRFLRRAAIIATRAAMASTGTAASARDAYRLAAALWATALESACVWDALDAARTAQGVSALPTDKRAELTEAARQRLLNAIRARSTSGWSKDDVDFTSAWVDYEFACSALFAKSGIGFALNGWVKGLAAAPYLLMKDDGQMQAAIMLRNARESIVSALAQFDSQPQFGPQPSVSPARTNKLGIYLQPIVGFAEYLLDTNRPALALLHLNAEKNLSAAAQRARARALADQAALLSTSSTSAKDALQMFEQAASLKADLSGKQTAIVQAAVTLSRDMLNSQPSRPETALQPIEIAKRLAGSNSELNSATAAVYVQQAIQLQRNDKLEAAEQKFRAALALSNEKPTRDLFAGLLERRANEILYENKVDQALNLMRESMRMAGRIAESEIDYKARCELQMDLINTGFKIAADNDAGTKEVDIAIAMGMVAQRILDDEDVRNFLGDVHREMGRLYGNQKNWDRAIEHLEKAVGFKNSEDYRKMLARLLLIRGAKNWDAGYRTSGARDINRAYSLDSSNPDIRRAWSMVP